MKKRDKVKVDKALVLTNKMLDLCEDHVAEIVMIALQIVVATIIANCHLAEDECMDAVDLFAEILSIQSVQFMHEINDSEPLQ